MIFAAKRLTRSDLTLFEAQYRIVNAGGQKSINLNRKVFVDLMFPIAATRAAGQAARFPVVLRIFGPNGLASVHQVTRKVIAAGGSQKNWRLNGEFIRDPDDGSNPGRYSHLHEGDLAVMGFYGEDVPTSIDMVVISQNASNDVTIAKELGRIMGTRAMATLSRAELNALVSVASAGHPLAELIDPEADEVLQEAALGSVTAIRLLRRRSIRRQSADDLAEALLRNAITGRNGEVLIAGHLRRLVHEGAIDSLIWESDLNASNPWDFTVHEKDGTVRRLEVKATGNSHDYQLYVSQAELEFAAESDAEPTQIVRVSELDGEGAVMRQSINFPEVAKAICDICRGFGPGLASNNWTLSPSRLKWSAPVTVMFEEDPDD